MKGLRIGIDIGGTFTDVVGQMGSKTWIVKVPTTIEDQSIGFVAGLEALAKKLGLTLIEMFGQTEVIIHGTTAATNALLEKKGASVGLLTTAGFRDVLEQREGYKPERYDVRLHPVEPLVPRHLRKPVLERIRHDGTVEADLDENSVLAAVEDFKAHGVEAVAVCLLHSYRNPLHEERVAAIVREHLADAYVSVSSQVLPVIKEYQRSSTTVVNAYVGPIMRTYLGNLEARVKSVGYDGPILIVQSHGGLVSIDKAIAQAAGCALSGPAGGVAGAVAAAKMMGEDNLITFDMGGTSSDIALIADGSAVITTERSIDDLEISLPSVDVHTIGSGGGSIADIGADGLLAVGPESAGSDPGPACYGRGGLRATTTDANFALGYFDTKNFMGGSLESDEAASDVVVKHLATKLSVSSEQAADGVRRVIGTQMAEGIRIVAVRAGRDPRDHAILSFGGAAGLHVSDIARQLGITRVIVPNAASAFSAWGMLTSALRFEAAQSVALVLNKENQQQIFESILRLEKDCERQVQDLSSDIAKGNWAVSVTFELRYGEQVFETPITLSRDDLSEATLAEYVDRKFNAEHRRLYGHAPGDEAPVLVNLRVALTIEPSRGSHEEGEPDVSQELAKIDQSVWLEGWGSVPVYAWDKTVRSASISGPCILRSDTTSVLLKAGDRGNFNELGWFVINVHTQVSEANSHAA